jgi:uncharacterized protein (DUF1499 family)
MVARYMQKEAHEGLWARRVALFFLQLLVLTVLLHHFASLSTPAAMNLMAVSMFGMLAAIAIALYCLVRIWFGGELGAGFAIGALVIALIGLAVPAYYMSAAVLLPPLTDIQTSPRDPLQFKQIPAQRPSDSNPIEDPDEVIAAEQETAYPDIRPMELERSSTEVFDMVKEAVKRIGWETVSVTPPSLAGPGVIEATDRTLIMGFTDDVAVAIGGDDSRATIDVRSVSRYGMHDLGTNAARIRAFFEEMKATLAKGEKTGLEQADVKPAPVAKKQVLKKRVKRKPQGARKRQAPPREAPRRSPFFLFR